MQIFESGFGRISGPLARPRNRAFRSKSSEAPMRFLWAFRCNPIAHATAANIKP
ncbi:MAG: hypothetical protein LBK44_05740 [Spirochaetales bacterium]|nr:hypothetical protein [Spirochaetales bacterium]